MVDIRVDLETLTGLTENPGELAGFGPVIADIARRVTAEQESAEWRWTVVDDNNQVVHTGVTPGDLSPPAILRRCAVITTGPNTRHHGNPPSNPTVTTPGSADWDTYTTSGRSP